MKTNVQKLIGTAVLGLALFSNSLPAWAGQKTLSEVLIVPGAASGSMVGARYSGDSKQYIGCVLDSNGGVGCSAQDKTGKSFVCYANNPGWVSMVKSITDSSAIYLGGTGNGSCDYLFVENHSSHLK
jgi:hypothetical protein